MSTVGQVIDRVFREYLHLVDDQPVQTPLASGVDDTTTSWVLASSLLAPDEADVYVEGSMVECGRELALITNVDASAFPTSITLTVIRGMAGTTAAAHSSAAMVVAAPTFPREAVFDAVCDNVVALYPSLYRVGSSDVTVAGYVEVPAATIDPIGFTYTSGPTICTGNVQLFTDLAPAVSSTGKAVTINAPHGKAGRLTYRAMFDRPTAEADDLVATIGLDQSWERIIVVGTAAQVLAGRELDQVTQEYVTEQIRGQGYPVESASRQRNELIRLYQLMLARASSRQMSERDEVVTLSMPRFGSL